MKVDRSIVEPQLSDSKVIEGKNSSDMISLDEIVQELGGLLQQQGLDASQASKIANRFVVRLKKNSSVSDTVDNKSGEDEDTKPKAKEAKVEPPATTTPAADGTRTFNGQYRVHWKVGKSVDLKHNCIDWLSGTVTRVRYTDLGDVYDVKLSNGDVVLNVSSDNLRTWIWLQPIRTLMGCFNVAAFIYLLVLMREKL